jgi:GT2 family glycosyltransferase
VTLGEYILAQSNPRVVAVIPSLGKNLSRLNLAIESIKIHTSYPNLKIIVVDNSAKGTLSNLNSVDEVIWTGINLGNVGALEFVRKSYDFEYLWSVQDDMTILNDVLGILLNELSQNSKVGVASPVLIQNGVIPAFTRGGIFTDRENIKWTNVPEKDIKPELFFTNSDLCFVAGSGALWRKEALDDISGFDLEMYPLMHGDVDTCFRLKQRNWNLSLLTNAHITHEINGSTVKILGQTLGEINENIIKSKFLNRDKPKKSYINELNKEFLFALSKKSSHLFLEISSKAQEQIERLEDEKNAIEKDYFTSLEIIKEYQILNNSLINSNSWKITKPLRKIGTYFKFKLKSVD